MFRLKFTGGLAFLSLLLFAQSVTAHVYWMRMHGEQEIAVEYQMASFDTDFEFRNPYNLDFSGYFHTAGNVYIATQIPVANDWIDGIAGNPYLGVEIVDKRKSSLMLQLGVRLPLASDDYEVSYASYTGYFIATDQFEAFIHYSWVLQPVIGYQWILPHGLDVNHVFKLSGGPTAVLPAGSDNLMLFDMNAEAWIEQIDRFAFGAGLQGRIPISDDDRFTDSFLGFACFSARFQLGHLHPSFRFMLPLTKDFSDNIDFALNVEATVDLIKYLK